VASVITPSHLAPFAKAFAQALREGTITVEQAREFCDITFNMVQEHQVLTPRGKSNGKAEQLRERSRA
jgi:hypothetical protein